MVSFAFVAFAAPLMFYLQEVRGLSPTRAALLIAPLAIATGILAPMVGRIVDHVPPRPIVGFGFATLAAGLFWLALEMTPTTPVWRLVAPLTIMGIAGAFTWEPLAVIASRTLPPDHAGAGSAVYNTARQVGAVLSSAGIAALMTWLLSGGHDTLSESAGMFDAAVHSSHLSEDPVAVAMSHSMLLPAFAAAVGFLAALFFVGRPHSVDHTAVPRHPTSAGVNP